MNILFSRNRELAVPEWRLSTIALDGRIIDP